MTMKMMVMMKIMVAMIMKMTKAVVIIMTTMMIKMKMMVMMLKKKKMVRMKCDVEDDSCNNDYGCFSFLANGHNCFKLSILQSCQN